MRGFQVRPLGFFARLAVARGIREPEGLPSLSRGTLSIALSAMNEVIGAGGAGVYVRDKQLASRPYAPRVRGRQKPHVRLGSSQKTIRAS